VITRRTNTGRTRRTHVVLSERLYKALRARARQEGTSVSALVEQYCGQQLPTQEEK
jgi:hypothetical protein